MIPVVAVGLLEANAIEVGILNLMDAGAALAFGLLIGRITDRLGGAASVLLANVIRLAGVATLVFALAQSLTLPTLIVCMILFGAASLLREAGASAAVVEFVGRDDQKLNRANAALRTADTIAGLGAPGIGGVLVAASSALFAVALGGVGVVTALGAATFVVLMSRRDQQHDAFLMAIKTTDEKSAETASLVEGFRYIASHHFLRKLVGSSFQFNAFSAMLQAVFVIFCIRVLGFGIIELSVIGVVSGAAAIAGAAVASSAFAARHTAKIYGAALFTPAPCVAVMLTAEHVSARAGSLALVVVADALFTFAIVMCVVLFNTARQLATPDRILGQVAASERMIALVGEVPGALIGGILGTLISVQSTMVVAMLGMALSVTWLRALGAWPSSNLGSSAVTTD